MTTKENILSALKGVKPELSDLGVTELRLFGSYVREEQSPKSDIDVLIDFEPEKATFRNFLSVCERLENLFSNQTVEIVTKNSLSRHFEPFILSEVQYV